jgi:hypothetical protein
VDDIDWSLPVTQTTAACGVRDDVQTSSAGCVLSLVPSTAHFKRALLDHSCQAPKNCANMESVQDDGASCQVNRHDQRTLALHGDQLFEACQYVLRQSHLRQRKQEGQSRFCSLISVHSIHAETLFGKMARSFLRHIRVQSLDELKARILKGVEEINAAPVVHRWKNFDALAQD